MRTTDEPADSTCVDDSGPGGILAMLGWAGRTDVERVRRYTVWSLRAFLWIFVFAYGAPALGESVSRTAFLVGFLLLVLLGALGDRAVRLSIDRWPAQGVPMGDPRVVALLVAAVPMAAWSLWAGGWSPGGVLDRTGGLLALTCALGWGLGGFRSQRLHTVLVLGAFGLLWWAGGDLGKGVVAAVFAAFLVFTMQSSLWLLGVVEQLDRARRTEAELAVAQERLRFSSDVHDVMGRHLSTLAVQAELAAALVTKGDDRALERIQQVRTTAHDALREARELARGYRPVDLAREVEGAVALLTSAGVRVEGAGERLSEALATDLPASWHEPVAKVVREAVTNVLRHSRATWVRGDWDGRTLTFSNDGAAPAAATDGGSGLATLATDLAARGATVTHARDGDLFTLTIEFLAVQGEVS